MLAPSFRTKLNTPIQPGLACLGHFEGDADAVHDEQGGGRRRGATLAIASSGNRVLLHSSSDTAAARGGHDESGGARYLNLNRQVSALSCGRFKGGSRDTLLVGSTSSLLAYDVHDNSDKFFAEVPEGVRSLRFGNLHGIGEPLIFVGGDCSLQGFDRSGTEQFWTVVGGCATSMILADVDRDGKDELVVGSDDFEIRAFQNEQSLFEITETESVQHLCPLETNEAHSSRFAYGLRNGTIGVYDGKTRVWRVKAKDDVQAMVAYDIDGDGVQEIISGWSNGKLEARRHEDGSVVYRETLDSPITALFTGDFRGTGSEELICCTLSGEVRGYDGHSQDAANLRTFTGADAYNFGETTSGMDALAAGRFSGDEVMRALRGDLAIENDAGDQAIASSLMHQQQDPRARVSTHNAELAQLQEQLTLKTMELRSLEDNLKHADAGNMHESLGSLPAHAGVNVTLSQNLEASCLDLCVQASEGCLVHSVLIFSLDAGLFTEGECVAGMNSAGTGAASGRLVVSLRPLKNAATKLRVQAMVSARGASEFLHIFELEQPLRRFSMFAPAQDTSDRNRSLGNASFFVPNQTLEAVRSASDRLFEENTVPKEHVSHELCFELASLRDDSLLRITAAEEPNGGVRMKVESTTLEIVSEFVQALARELDLQRLEACLDFPTVLHHLEGLLARVAELRSLRQRLNAEMADESNYIKSLVVRAEDARVLQDVTNLTSTYADLTSVNLQLIGEYNKRSNNQAELLAALREVNQIIQRASQVRVGAPQAAVVSACRKALKSQSIPALFHAITSMKSS
ncbi:Bardet-Biedl syndrome 2 protein-like [Hondaea fermentalgiana]|uniref:Bardet-Biedl syndrome 2 protein-like n=1 Tax=Hondaea fermentalgiana TaxID=2315210 RepID=A0A2R5GQB5_9STRA|nr:Bardet-Biedl syndrome 2 protein-like [Hondaea fermentalgiana]|eukprot:GBG31968.1 Bardet-Biedl syndrome 2 protein-like [Hondaea fermentalgiana]